MILFSKPNSPDLECRDGGQMEAAIAKGYARNMGNTPAKVAAPTKTQLDKYFQKKSDELVAAAIASEVDTPEAAYERKFGKAPHHKMKLETIIAKLEE